MRGVTLLELVVVLVIIGVVTGVGFYAFRPNYLRSDTDFVVSKLQEFHYRAIGYEKSLKGLGEVHERVGCFALADLKDTNGSNYTFRSSISWDYGSQRFCFDSLGRVYRADTKEFQRDIITIYVQYGNDETNVTIYPLSGHIEKR